MTTVRLSTKGQIVLPKSLRDDLDWQSGAELVVERGEGESVTLRRKSTFPRTRLEDVAGMFKFDRIISDEEIEAAIENERRARWKRTR